MLIRIRCSLLIGLWAAVAAACQPAAPAPTFTPHPIKAQASSTPTPAFSSAPFSDSLLLTVVKNQGSGSDIYPVDPLTGRPLEGYPPIHAKNYVYAFSPDVEQLALITFAGDPTPFESQLHLLSLKDWRDQVFDLKLDGWVNTIRFSPDSGMLAIAYGDSGNRLMVLDAASGTARAQAETEIIVRLMRFSKDGTSLMLYGPPQPRSTRVSPAAPKAILLAVRDLSVQWTSDLAGVRDGLFPKTDKVDDLHAPGQAWYFTPAIAFAPDRDALYIVHADEDRFTSVDFSLRLVRTVDIRPRLSWFEQLLMLGASAAHAKVMDGTDKQMVISPDGGRLYVVGIDTASSQHKDGTWDMRRTPLGLQVIDAADGTQIGHYATDATNLAISPDGRKLYLRGWNERATTYAPWTEIFDLASGERTAAPPDLDLVPTQTMGGWPILVSSRPISEVRFELAVLDPQSLMLLNRLYVTEYGSWLIP
jgi:DNA-binding beta-propeller fold protein YncE